MTKTKICDTCIYFAPKESGLTVINRGVRENKKFGQCRKHAPILKKWKKWPEVFGDEWCGDYKDKINDS